jgi:hypothetical protein
VCPQFEGRDSVFSVGSVWAISARGISRRSSRDKGRPVKPDVVTRTALDTEAVAGEARKGYDLLVVGIANTRDSHDGFSKYLSLLTQGFDGPFVVWIADGAIWRASGMAAF